MSQQSLVQAKTKAGQFTPTINIGWVKPRNKVKTSVKSSCFPSK